MNTFTKSFVRGFLMASLGVSLAGAATAQTVNSWITTGDQSKLLQQQAAASFSGSTAATGTTITVDEDQTFQTMDGFGAAMTGSAAYVMNHYLTPSQCDALMNELFSPSGIHLSFMRHTIGASDFSPTLTGDYTYDDVLPGQTDTGLSSFSIAKELTDVVPMLRLAIAKNSSLRILGSPWSAPAWMKSNGTLRNGGSLNASAYPTYANYFVKYVQAFAAQGVPIYAMTMQNEPRYETAGYMSMLMPPAEQAAFLKVLGPAFRSASISTKIMVYDHNWDLPSYPTSIYADADAAQYAAGSAWHGYSDPAGITNITSVHDAYPTKDNWFTEISGSSTGDFANDMKFGMSNTIIGNTRNWTKGSLLWNLALDQINGPVNGTFLTGRGVVTINNLTGAVTRNAEYYILGHASKFVDQGAVRIASNSVAGGLENVSFRNPDGSKVVVALNNSSADITFKIQWGPQAVNYTLPAGAIATYKWTGSPNSITAGHVYKVLSQNSGKALDVKNASTANGANLQQRDYSGSSNQQWRLDDMGGGYYRFTDVKSGKVMEVSNSSTANGALIQQYDWTGGNNQLWKLTLLSDGSYQVLSKLSGKVLDVIGASTANGVGIQQYDWSGTGGSNQKWLLTDLNSSTAARTATTLATASSASITEGSLQVYPTIVDRTLHLNYSAPAAQIVSLRVLDVTGRLVASQPDQQVVPGANNLTMPVATLAAGIYLFRLTTPDGQLVRRIIVTH